MTALKETCIDAASELSMAMYHHDDNIEKRFEDLLNSVDLFYRTSISPNAFDQCYGSFATSLVEEMDSLIAKLKATRDAFSAKSMPLRPWMEGLED